MSILKPPVEATQGGTGLTVYAQGDLLYASSASAISTLAKNTTATRYLSNTGTSNNPAWAQIALTTGVTGTLPVANGGTGQISYAGNKILLQTQAASASATIDFTTNFTSTYDQYVFEYFNVLPATDLSALWMRFSVDNGSTFITTNTYNSAGYFQDGAGAVSSAASNGAQWIMSRNVKNTTGYGTSGTVVIYAPTSAAVATTGYQVSSSRSGSALISTYNTAMQDDSVRALNAFRFLFSAGNITSGTFNLYGVSK